MVNINSDNKQFKPYRYGIYVRIIPDKATQSDAIILTNNVSELRIIKDFDNKVYPYFRLTCAVSVDDAIKIQKVWKTAKLYLSVMGYTPDSDFTNEKDNSVSEIKLIEDIFIDSKIFKIMVCDGSPPHIPEGQDSDLSRKVPSVLFRMELLPYDSLVINSNINNGVFHDSTVTNVISHLVVDNIPTSTNNSPYRFLFTPPDNINKKDISLEPLNFVPAVRYIDKVYGIYSGNMTIFLDVNIGYILSSTKSTINKDPKSAIGVTLELLSPDEMNPSTGGVGSAYDETSKIYRIRTNQRIQASVDGPANKQLNGEQIKLVRSTNDEKCGANCKNLTIDGILSAVGLKQRVYQQVYDNPLIADKMKVNSREQYAPTSVKFTSPNLSMFTPELPWTLITNMVDQSTVNLEGNWRLTAMEAILTKAPGTAETANVEVMVNLVPSAIES